jgi:hypothetical protein
MKNIIVTVLCVMLVYGLFSFNLTESCPKYLATVVEKGQWCGFIYGIEDHQDYFTFFRSEELEKGCYFTLKKDVILITRAGFYGENRQYYLVYKI